MRNDISEGARDVLAYARIEGTVLYLPPRQLERTLYEEVNEVLTRLGGKWKSGKVKGHVFETDPTSDVQVAVTTGQMPPKNPTAFFSTPQTVIDQLLDIMNASIKIVPGTRFLEPSAGKGAIALALRYWLGDRTKDVVLHVCEIQPTFAVFLQAQGLEVIASDFLTYTPAAPYQVIVMNPPFAIEGDTLAYITHILHAWEMLAPGGILVAIAPPGYTFRSDKKSKQFLSLVEQNGGWEKLRAESFKESGTGVETTILHIVKPTLAALTERIVENAHTFARQAERLQERVQANGWQEKPESAKKQQATRTRAYTPPPPPTIDHAAYQQTPLHDYLHPRPALSAAAFGHLCSDECYQHFGVIRLGTAIFAVRVQSRAVGADVLGYEPLGEATAMFSEAIAQVKRALRFSVLTIKQAGEEGKEKTDGDKTVWCPTQR